MHETETTVDIADAPKTVRLPDEGIWAMAGSIAVIAAIGLMMWHNDEQQEAPAVRAHEWWVLHHWYATAVVVAILIGCATRVLLFMRRVERSLQANDAA